jgi:peptide/nickel transport system substrate-binding protein
VNGSHQFILHLLNPNYSLPSILTSPAFGIASPAAIQTGTLSTNPVGSGPFSFVEWIAGDRIQLAANPSYWNGRPSLTSLEFMFILTDTSRLTAIQGNTIQAALDLPDEYTTIVQLDPNLRVYTRPSWTIGYLGMNQAKTPLDNIYVRQAIAHAINLPKLITDHYGTGNQPADQFLPPAIWGYNPSAPDYAYDPTLAKSLLAQAGYVNEPITLSYRDVFRPYLPNPSIIAAAIQADLTAVGMNITIVVMESSYFLDEYQKGNLELFLLGWGADFLHPDNFFTPHFCSNNIGFGPQDGVLCDLVNAAWVDPDYIDQLNLYRSASIRVMEKLPVLPLAYYTPLVVARSNVAGLNPSPLVMQDWYGRVFYAENWLFLPAVLR